MGRGRPKVPRGLRLKDGKSHEVTVTRLPVVRCGRCGATMAHQPGAAAGVLTAHYARRHPQ